MIGGNATISLENSKEMANILKQSVILVTPKSYGANDPSLKTELENQVSKVSYNNLGRSLNEDDLISMVPEVDGFIAGLDYITKKVIQAAPRLKVISRYGVGVDRVDIDAATSRGIIVTNTPGTNSASVAELTIGLILALLRKICQLNQSTKSGRWALENSISLKNKRMGLIGFGAIGKETALRLQPFGCTVLVCDPFIPPSVQKDYSVIFRDLESLLSESDVISLHMPATRETEKFVNATFLSKMKKGAFLINTARGELLDHDAVLNALESGQLAGLAIDAFDQEPPNLQDPLFALEQVIATPHCGSHTDEAMNSMGRMALENCLASLRGEIPAHIVNPEVLQKK